MGVVSSRKARGSECVHDPLVENRDVDVDDTPTKQDQEAKDHT